MVLIEPGDFSVGCSAELDANFYNGNVAEFAINF